MTTGAAAGLGMLIGLSVLLPSPGCGRREPDVRTRLDTLRTDKERLMIVRFLPPGLSYEEALRRLPTLGAALPSQGGKETEATAPFAVLGHAATLTLGFGTDGLSRWTYRMADTDSASAASAYRRLQGIYTMEFGNYHEKWDQGTDGAVSSSFWSSSTLGATVVIRSRGGTYTLEWRFEPLENIIKEND